MTQPKVFQVGFNKCGTTSLHLFFQQCGLRSVQHSVDRDSDAYALRLYDNLVAGRRVIDGFENYDAFTDMNHFCEHERIEIGRYWRVLMEQEPDARFVLNIRNVNRWVNSCIRWATEHDHDNPPLEECLHSWHCGARMGFAENYRRYYGLTSPVEVANHLRCNWHAHVWTVRHEMPADRLLVFDIERDDPALLCDFLGLPRSMAEHYGHANASTPPAVRAMTGWIPTPVKRLMPRAIKNHAKVLLGRVSR